MLRRQIPTYVVLTDSDVAVFGFRINTYEQNAHKSLSAPKWKLLLLIVWQNTQSQKETF